MTGTLIVVAGCLAVWLLSGVFGGPTWGGGR